MRRLIIHKSVPKLNSKKKSVKKPRFKKSVKKSSVRRALRKRRVLHKSPRNDTNNLSKVEPKIAVMRVIVRKGYVRQPYVRKSGTLVKAAVVKSGKISKLGLPGPRHRVIPKLHKGLLSDLGYSAKASKKSRYEALGKAVKAYGALSVSKKLNAVYVLNRNTNPKVAEIFHNDRMHVAKKYLEH